MTAIRLHFTDYFDVDPAVSSDHGALNVSLINDSPLFIDPFLLFDSTDEVYQELHREMIDCLRFLRAKSQARSIPAGLLSGWYRFPEVKQNWLGFSKKGNSGRGLGHRFSASLNDNLGTVFGEFRSESATTGSHIEKLCLKSDGKRKKREAEIVEDMRLEMSQAEKEPVRLDDVESPDVEASGFAAVPAITMEQFAETLLTNELTKDRFSPHPAIEGAYLLDLGEDEQAEITFDRDVYDRHTDVQFLTYGHSLLDRFVDSVGS